MEIEFSDLVLSTITVEAKITNIKFKEMILIQEIIKTVSENPEITDNVLKIGCNYGVYTTEKYEELTKPKPKSNRGRKKKVKPVATRKIQGNGKYFNSQITFTIQDNEIESKFYHLKLFTNGTIQIPSVCNKDIMSIKYIIDKVIDIIKFYNVKDDQDKDIEIVYIKSIMKNYKFKIIDESILIDLNKFRKVFLNFKHFVKNNQEISLNSEYYISNIDTELYKEYYEELTTLQISLIKHSNERYIGAVVKFSTPTEKNPKKETTVTIFSSGKMNINGANSSEQSELLQKILYRLLMISQEYVLYRKI